MKKLLFTLICTLAIFSLSSNAEETLSEQDKAKQDQYFKNAKVKKVSDPITLEKLFGEDFVKEQNSKNHKK